MGVVTSSHSYFQYFPFILFKFVILFGLSVVIHFSFIIFFYLFII